MKQYESMTVQEKWNMLAVVANLYYNSELTQNEIAERMYTSRSKISRMLKEARELGVVEISIKEPWERELDLEGKLMEKFSINSVRVVMSKERDKEKDMKKLSEVSAYYLDSIVKPDMVVGISWGNTLYHIVKYIAANNRKNIPITVVPIMGAASMNKPERDAMDLAKDLASAYGGKYQYIYAPLFVNSRELKESLIQDDSICKVLDMAKHANVVLTSVGSIEYKTWKSYLGETMFKKLDEFGAVGHIGGHFYNINGEELKTSLIDRMIGVEMKDLKACERVVCIAYGNMKAKAVLGALRGGFLDTLIIDKACADEILTISSKK